MLQSHFNETLQYQTNKQKKKRKKKNLDPCYMLSRRRDIKKNTGPVQSHQSVSAV